MRTVYRKKCVLCKEYFTPNNNNKKYCEDCKKKIEPKKRLKSNNNKGNNQYKVEIVEEAVITKEEVQKAYRELWKAKCIVLSKAQIYNRLHKKFMGYDKIDEEMKKLCIKTIKDTTKELK